MKENKSINSSIPDIVIGKYDDVKSFKSNIGSILSSKFGFLSKEDIKIMIDKVVRDTSNKFKKGDKIIHYDDCEVLSGIEGIFLIRKNKSILASIIRRK